ncbi:MAG TPA: hypothetical protein VH143_18905 [Kofleriaceae bacterium]|nr:hypothetical protein [Kofleriaceae bacterium]
MVRPTILVCAFAFGCTGTIDDSAQSGGMSLTPTQQLALDAWNQLALPAFTSNMCVTCHEGQMLPAGAPAYLLGSSSTDQRDAAIATTPPVINLTSPRSSRVLVKGMHEGPALDAPSATDILTWITYEHDARMGSATLPETTPYTMMDCTGGSAGSTTCPLNSIDLTSAGAAGTVTFTESPLAGESGNLTDIELQPLTITAGAMGLHVVHPLFGTMSSSAATGSGSGSGSASTGPTFDPEDRFFSIDMELAPNATLELGATSFANFAHTDPLVVQFDVLSAEDAGSGSD